MPTVRSSGGPYQAQAAPAPAPSTQSTQFKIPVAPGSEMAQAYGRDPRNLGGLATTPRARHSPDLPDAFVLARPTPGTEEVAVVVDPVLAMKLRPHQTDGVRFIWEACMGQQEGSPGRGCILADGARAALHSPPAQRSPTGRLIPFRDGPGEDFADYHHDLDAAQAE